MTDARSTPSWPSRLWLGLRRWTAMALFAVAFICEGLAEAIHSNPFDN